MQGLTSRPALIDHRLHRTERSRAYYLRGFSFYAEGLFVSAALDYTRALTYNPDNPMAMLALGGLYLRGEGVATDPDIALVMLGEAASAGNAGAMCYLGSAYLHGEGFEVNVDTARDWLIRGADAGNAGCMQQLALAHRGEFGDTDPEAARGWYERAFEAGAPDALVSLGYMYLNGELGSPDMQAALAEFYRAADKGSGNAMAAIAHAHLIGSGVTEDPEAARDWFGRAAAAGHADSWAWLGYIHASGTPPDQEEALLAYQKGAAAGSNESRRRLVQALLADERYTEALLVLAPLAEAGLPEWRNGYAWLLATSTEDRLRDGRMALRHAQAAVAAERNPAYLDTLAAAHAELGEFDSAVSIQREAIELAGDESLAEFRRHLDAYLTGQPWRE